MILRILFSIILLLLSLLVVFRAPTNLLWRISVAVTEFPYIFICAALLLLILSFGAEKYKYALILVNGIALILYTIPIVKAYQVSSEISENFTKTFPFKPTTGQLQPPFSFLKMFTGIETEDVKFTNIVYNNSNEKKLSLDYYPGNSRSESPCVIVIHGGSWSEGDSKQLPALNSYLANKGYNVAALNYRLAPEFKCPSPVEDVKYAIKYLTENASALKIDTNNFILLGRSAGGQIALLAAYTYNDPNIKGVITFYAPADMVWGAGIKGNTWVINTDKVLSDYIGGSLNEFPQKYTASSPVEFIDSSSTPTLIIHGQADVLVAFEHSTRLQKKLNQYHVKNYLLDLPCATHGCDYNINGPSGQVTTFTIERFINSVVSKPTI
ncbi:MAG: alpha/beta hydrolase [Bacteroidota bacterium]